MVAYIKRRIPNITVASSSYAGAISIPPHLKEASDKDQIIKDLRRELQKARGKPSSVPAATAPPSK